MSTTLSPITSVNPATEEVLAPFDAFTPEEVDRALDEAQDAFIAWRERSIADRAIPMKRLAALLRERADRYGRLITIEMGKPITEAKAEIEKCAWGAEHYADNAARYLADEVIEATAQRSFVAFEPLGDRARGHALELSVLAGVPLRRAGAHGRQRRGAEARVERAAVRARASKRSFRDAGFPEGVLRTVLVAGVGGRARHRRHRIRAVTLTGSSDTGSRIAELAGRALKKSVLELGGSDPFIVLADADLDAAAKVGARARNQNAGQSCIAAKRFIVVESVARDFERRFAAEVEDAARRRPARSEDADRAARASRPARHARAPGATQSVAWVRACSPAASA